MSTVNDNDKFLVERENISYTLTADKLMSNIQDTDLMLIERSDVSYKVSAKDVKEQLGPKGEVLQPSIYAPTNNAGRSINTETDSITAIELSPDQQLRTNSLYTKDSLFQLQSFGIGAHFTFAFWYNRNRATSGERRTICTGTNIDDYYYIGSDNKIHQNNAESTSASSYATTQVIDNINDGEWHHVCITFDISQFNSQLGNGAQEEVHKIYVDGVLIPWQTKGVADGAAISIKDLCYTGGYQASVQARGFLLTDVYLVKDQTLLPSNFGFFDAYGNFTPREFNGTGQFVHFSFSDPSNLGLDTSGNGLNSPNIHNYTSADLTNFAPPAPTFVNLSLASDKDLDLLSVGDTVVQDSGYTPITDTITTVETSAAATTYRVGSNTGAADQLDSLRQTLTIENTTLVDCPVNSTPSTVGIANGNVIINVSSGVLTFGGGADSSVLRYEESTDGITWGETKESINEVVSFFPWVRITLMSNDVLGIDLNLAVWRVTTIANQTELTFATPKDLENFRPGDPVKTEQSAWEARYVPSSSLTTTPLVGMNDDVFYALPAAPQTIDGVAYSTSPNPSTYSSSNFPNYDESTANAGWVVIKLGEVTTGGSIKANAGAASIYICSSTDGETWTNPGQTTGLIDANYTLAAGTKWVAQYRAVNQNYLVNPVSAEFSATNNVLQATVGIISSDDGKVTVDGGTWSNGETVIGPDTTPGTGIVASTGADSLTLATVDETFPKRWVANASKYAIGPVKEIIPIIETDEIIDVETETLNIAGFYGIVVDPIEVSTQLDVGVNGYTGPGYNQGLVFRDQDRTWHEIGGDIGAGNFNESYLSDVQALGFTHITGFAVRGNRPEPADNPSATNTATCFLTSLIIDGTQIAGSQINIIKVIGNTVVTFTKYTWENFIAGTGSGVAGDGATTSVNAGTILTFATNKHLTLLNFGDAVTQDDGAANGTVAGVTGTTMELATSTGTWSANTDNYVVGPELPLPDFNGVNFVGSEFEFINRALTHGSSDWQVTEILDEGYSSVVSQVVGDPGVGPPPQWTSGELEPDTDYRARVRYTATTGEVSPWSEDTLFKTREGEDLTGGNYDQAPVSALGLYSLNAAPETYGNGFKRFINYMFGAYIAGVADDGYVYENNVESAGGAWSEVAAVSTLLNAEGCKAKDVWFSYNSYMIENSLVFTDDGRLFRTGDGSVGSWYIDGVDWNKEYVRLIKLGGVANFAMVLDEEKNIYVYSVEDNRQCGSFTPTANTLELMPYAFEDAGVTFYDVMGAGPGSYDVPTLFWLDTEGHVYGSIRDGASIANFGISPGSLSNNENIRRLTGADGVGGANWKTLPPIQSMGMVGGNYAQSYSASWFKTYDGKIYVISLSATTPIGQTTPNGPVLLTGNYTAQTGPVASYQGTFYYFIDTEGFAWNASRSLAVTKNTAAGAVFGQQGNSSQATNGSALKLPVLIPV